MSKHVTVTTYDSIETSMLGLQASMRRLTIENAAKSIGTLCRQRGNASSIDVDGGCKITTKPFRAADEKFENTLSFHVKGATLAELRAAYQKSRKGTE